MLLNQNLFIWRYRDGTYRIRPGDAFKDLATSVVHFLPPLIDVKDVAGEFFLRSFWESDVFSHEVRITGEYEGVYILSF